MYFSALDLNRRKDTSPFMNGSRLARAAANETLLESYRDMMGSKHFEETSDLELRQVREDVYIPNS